MRCRARICFTQSRSLILSHRLIRIDHHPARIRRRARQPQRFPVLEDPHPAPDRDRVHEDVEFVDQIVLDQGAHKRRATVHDDVLPPLLLQAGNGLDQVTGSTRTFLPSTRARVLLNTTFGVSTILRAKMYSGLSGFTASQYLMKPSVIFLPSRMESLESVIWTMRPITPSSRLRVIQSNCPSGPATNPSTLICTCSLSLRIVAMSERPVGWSHLCVESGTPKSTGF